MINLIPVQFRLAAAVIAFVIVGSLSATAGAKIATWRAEASCAKAKEGLNDRIVDLTAEVVDLKEAIAEANKALAIAKEKSDAIEMAQAEAAKLAAMLQKSSEERLGRLKAEYAAATSCNGVLKSYWNARK